LFVRLHNTPHDWIGEQGVGRPLSPLISAGLKLYPGGHPGLNFYGWKDRHVQPRVEEQHPHRPVSVLRQQDFAHPEETFDENSPDVALRCVTHCSNRFRTRSEAAEPSVTGANVNFFKQFRAKETHNRSWTPLLLFQEHT
jgi:hypothetical protein